MPPTLFQGRGKTKKQGCHLMRWRPKAPPRTPLHLSPDTSLGPEAEEEDERDRADLRGWGGWRSWELTGNGFQEQIEGAGQRKKRTPHSCPRFRPAQPRLPGPGPLCLPVKAPSILTPPPASRRHSPNRNRLLCEGVSGRARNAKPGNRREPEPPPQHRKSCSEAAEEEEGVGREVKEQS